MISTIRLDLIQKKYDEIKNLIKEVPVDIEAIGGILGLFLYKADLPDDVSGLYIRQRKLIYVNKKDSFERQRFTIGHEIAHNLLHKKEEEVLTRSNLIYREDNWESLSSSLKSEQKSIEKLKIEVEADIFSSWLLIPFHLLRELSEEELKDYKKIAEIFHVSVAVAKRRMETLHLSEEYKQTVKLPKQKIIVPEKIEPFNFN